VIPQLKRRIARSVRAARTENGNGGQFLQDQRPVSCLLFFLLFEADNQDNILVLKENDMSDHPRSLGTMIRQAGSGNRNRQPGSVKCAMWDQVL